MPKPHSRRVIATLAAILSAPLAIDAEVTTFTAPSGYTTIVADAASDASTPTYSFVSHSLARKRQAAAVVTSGGTDTLTVTDAGWTPGEFAGTPHYVLIASGDTEGDIFNIVSNTADTLTVSGAGDLSALATVSITIYEHNTLTSVFGADPTTKGLTAGLDANTADQIIFYDGAAFKTYFYKNVNIPDFLDPNDILGWVTSADNTTDVGDTILPPNEGFVILRRALTALSVVAFGDVIDDSVNVPIADGYNLICVPYPVSGSVTLGTSGLYDSEDTDYSHSLQPGLDANTAELVVLWDGTAYKQYFYKNVNIPDFLDPNDILGWVSSADNTTDASGTPLDGSFFILRKAPNPALNWVFPTVVSP
jgi:uncharacterized protein (TIGR02597 family)